VVRLFDLPFGLEAEQVAIQGLLTSNVVLTILGKMDSDLDVSVWFLRESQLSTLLLADCSSGQVSKPHCLCKLHDLAASVFVREFHSQEECSRAWRCNSWQTFSWASFVGFDAVRGQEGEKTRSVTRTFPVFDSRMSKSSSGMRSTYQLIDGRKLICSDGYVLYRSL
jgi:hypothetical protein